MSIPRSFSIVLDDVFITNPPNDNDEPRIQAQADENSDNAAIFTLNDGILESGDWYLGRFLVEDRSLHPKRVFWLRKENTEADFVHRTEIEQLDGNVYGVKNGRGSLTVIDGKVWADLLGAENIAVVKLNGQ